MRAIGVQRGSHRVLHRARAAEPAVGELLDRAEDLIELFRAADAEPAGAPARRDVGLRQRREREDRRVRRQRAEQRHGAVETEFAVDLVGENRHAGAIGDVDQGAPEIFGIAGASRVVRIDRDDRPCRRADQPLDVVEVRQPAVGRIAAVINRARADLREHRRVERIRRCRHQHFVTGVGHRAEGQFDAFGRAGSDDDPINADRHPAPFVFGGHRFARRNNADRRGVAVVPVAHGFDDRVDQMRRCLETERNWVADIQIPHRPAGCLQLLRLADDVADRVSEAPNPRGRTNGGAGGHPGILLERGYEDTRLRGGEETRLRGYEDTRTRGSVPVLVPLSPRPLVPLSRQGSETE